MARVLPAAMNVVCAPLVCPYCKEAMVPPKLRSTPLLMFDAVVLPVSKNFTSSPLAGALPVFPAVALVQLAPADQLFSPAPGPFQIRVSACESGAAARPARRAKSQGRGTGVVR